MTTLSANFTTTLDRAIEKEIGKGTVAHTMVTNKSKPNTVTVVIHTNVLQPQLEDKVAAAVKKALKLDVHGIMFNSPRKIGDSITYMGQLVISKTKVEEQVDLPLMRSLIESGIPKMIAPGIKVSVPQEMRDKLMAAMKKMNYVPEGAAYSDGSTSWTAIASISADFNVDKFTAKLRRALGDFEGELNVRYYDLTKESVQEGAMPAMSWPGVVVVAPQAFRDELGKAIKELGYEIEGAGYTGGSTQWEVWFGVKKNFDIKKFEEKLRDKLNHDGWLEVEFEDLGA